MELPKQDADQLRLLSIFHYVVAAAAMLFALFPVIHLVVGLSLLTGNFGPPTSQDAPFGRQMGCLFVAIPSALILMGLTFGVLLIIAGRNLAARRSYTYCLVMAGVACAFMPFGTVLGVLTILVLMRESVKAEFGVGE